MLTSDVDRGGDALCRALAHLLEVHPDLGKPRSDHLAATRAATLHDPLAVACAVESSFVTIETLPVTVACRDGHVRTFVDPLEGEPAEVVRSVDGPRFVDYWLETVLALRS
jgi:inosine-uridine nucleoside N-ribohydrolase